MNFSPVGRPGYYGFEQTSYKGGTYTWIPTRQRWELSGGKPFTDAIQTSPNQAYQNALRQGKTTKQAIQAKKKQVNRVSNPSQNYQYGASVKTGTGQIISDYQSSQKAIQQMKQKAGDKVPPAVKQAVDAYTKQSTPTPPIVNQSPPPPKPKRRKRKAPPPPPPPPPRPPSPPPKAARLDLTGDYVKRKYKTLPEYGNQYPATISSVKSDIDYQRGDIRNFYKSGVVSGHFPGNKESVSIDQKILNSTVSDRLTTNFVVKINNKYYCGPNLKRDIAAASAEGNHYFINSIPCIVVDLNDIAPYGKEVALFGAEEDYAFNAPTDRIDTIDELLEHISWTCRKVATGIDEPRNFTGRYRQRDGINIDTEAVIASANKPLKIRWRRNS